MYVLFMLSYTLTQPNLTLMIGIKYISKKLLTVIFRVYHLLFFVTLMVGIKAVVT